MIPPIKIPRQKEFLGEPKKKDIFEYLEEISDKIINVLENLITKIDSLSNIKKKEYKISLENEEIKISEEKDKATRYFKPNTDIYLDTEEDKYYILVELPGFDKKDIKLKLKNNFLIIYAEKKEENEDKSLYYLLKERSVMAYKRILSIPEDADIKKINARFKNGLLIIEIPRKPVKEKEIKIE